MIGKKPPLPESMKNHEALLAPVHDAMIVHSADMTAI